MIYFFYIILGILPGVIWLSFYLRQDVHPESNKMIIKIFLFGMAISSLILAFESLWGYAAKFGLVFGGTFLFFIGPAFIEEYLKYYVVKKKVLDNPEFDEPVDAMLYLIIAALGFATIENVLFIASPVFASVLPLNVSLRSLDPLEALEIAGLRFGGATLLHALNSGIIGYFLAMVCFHAKKVKPREQAHEAILYSAESAGRNPAPRASDQSPIHPRANQWPSGAWGGKYPLFKYCDPQKRRKFLFTGLVIATVLHTTFNYFIINLREPKSAIYIVMLLGAMAFAVSVGFIKLRKLSI